MKKNAIKYGTSVLMLLLAVFTLSLSSCSDDDSSGGTPEITGVRVTDPEKADSLFTKSGPGQIIAIIGNNLGGALYVYINDQQVSFNSTMNTDHSIIVTVPTEEDGFKLSAFDSSIPDEIRVETRNGVATYAFKITAPSPSLQRIQGDYPRETGDILTLYGTNLVDIENIYITDVSYEELTTTTWTEVPGNHVAIPDYKVITQDHHLSSSTNSYQTTSVLQVAVPANAPEVGTLVIECASGITYVGYTRMPGVPVIQTCSSDMPQIGETLILTGRDFVQIESITYGDVTLTEDDFRVSDSQDSIYIDFQQKPTNGSGTTLTVTNPAGSATVSHFYDHSTILTTFDGDATDNGWGPNASYVDSGTADGIYAHIDVTDYGSNWWGTMIYFRKDWNGNSFPLSDNIPDNASASDVYLAFNVYDNNSDINSSTFSGYFHYLIQPIGDAENYYDNGYKASGDSWTFDQPVLAGSDGNAHKGKWYRAVVSLNNFDCFKGLNYAAIKNAGINQFRIMEYNQGANTGKVDVKFDNVRVIYIPSN